MYSLPLTYLLMYGICNRKKCCSQTYLHRIRKILFVVQHDFPVSPTDVTNFFIYYAGTKFIISSSAVDHIFSKTSRQKNSILFNIAVAHRRIDKVICRVL